MKKYLLAVGMLVAACSQQQIQQSAAVLSIVCEINGQLITEKVVEDKIKDNLAVAKEVCARKDGYLAILTVQKSDK